MSPPLFIRLLPLIAAPLLTACWTPGPGQVDPTRYPWDIRAQAARATAEQRARKPAASYCVMTIETGSATGITAGGGNAVSMACQEPR